MAWHMDNNVMLARAYEQRDTGGHVIGPHCRARSSMVLTATVFLYDDASTTSSKS
jgi:hypothetical protein